MSEQSEPPRKPTPTTRMRPLHRDPETPVEYDTLVRRYGEAMFRIGQLEAQVEALTRQLQEGPGGGSATAPAAQGQDLDASSLMAKRMDALEQRASVSAQESRQPTADREAAVAPGEVESSSPRRDAETTHLRVQIASLASQLAKTEQELRETRGSRPRRRSRNRGSRRPKWQFWRRSRHR